jgi:Na+-transporting NADH:ubiquinone oxidoreductase subunit C
MANESVGRTFLVAFLVCFVCSLLVSVTAAGLRARQERDAQLLHYRNVLEVAGLAAQERSIEELWQERVNARMVELETGAYTDAVDPQTYDQRRAATDPERNYLIPAEKDLADIRTRSRYAPVYLIENEAGEVTQLILPVHGKGLWSTLYGYLSLAPDLNTVHGFGFYEHGETPGLGGEIDNPKWQAKWPGKKLYDEQGRPKVEVIKGQVDPQSSDARYKVDGISGATMTSRGVTNLLRYWLGDDGFGTYIKNLRAQGGLHGQGA